MDMTGERRIPAPRSIVWDALNNPEVLKASIPGCESLEKLEDNQMKATAAIKVGPISARFSGKVQLLRYQVNAQVGGKLAQLGGRLIDATAKQMADAFFDRFSKQVQAMTPRPGLDEAPAAGLAPHAAEVAARQTMAEPVAVSMGSAVSIWALIPREPFGLPLAFWIGGGAFALMVLLMLGSML
jgi:carbon monoxide dehydrogenase subunit G